jgi:hypothetical protein
VNGSISNLVRPDMSKVGCIRLQRQNSLRLGCTSHADSLARGCRGVARARWPVVEVLIQYIGVLDGVQRTAKLRLVLLSSFLMGGLGQSASVMSQVAMDGMWVDEVCIRISVVHYII